MISIVFVFMGVVTVLAVFIVLAKRRLAKPKKPEKVEKAEVIKQLLTLAERENSISANSSPSSRSLRLTHTSDARNDTLQNCKQSPRSSSCPVPLGPGIADAEIEAQIRQRAYDLYQGRGGADGDAADDWRQAREEVLRRTAKAATTSS
jgi:hypothetical protein